MIKKKLKEYKIQMCKKHNISESSLMLCDLARTIKLTSKGNLSKKVKEEIERRVVLIAQKPKVIPKPTIEVKAIVEPIVDHLKHPIKKIEITAKFEVEVPENITAKQVENLYSNLAKKHFENCKEIVCQDAVS